MKVFSIFSAVLLFALPALSKTNTVDDDGIADYNNINQAVLNAQTGDVITVSPGTYTGENNRNISFAGKAITVRSADPQDPQIVAQTIIDCNAAGRAFIFWSGESTDSVLEGLTIKKGRNTQGGAIYCASGVKPTISNCIFIDCSATYGGAITSGSSAKPNVSGCAFISNSATVYGGAIYCLAGDITLTNCLFTSNSAIYGAACSFSSSDSKLTNCTFNSNTATVSGGAIYCYSSSNVTIENSILWADSAPTGPEIYLSNSGSVTSLVLSYSDIQGGQQQLIVETGCTLNYGGGNIETDPLFATGTYGDFYLSHIAAKQAQDSPCIDAANATAEALDLNQMSTRTDGAADIDQADLGVHYPATQKTAITADITIQPGTINIKNNAKWIFAYINLPLGYDIGDINTQTVTLQDQAQGIYLAQQVQAAVFKFSRSEISLEPAQSVPLTVTGNLTDGTPFQGSDSIKIISKGKKTK